MSTMPDSPLAALVSNYTSLGFLAASNNLWTLIAVIGTAALSFWRIRASVSSAISSQVREESLLPLSSSSSHEKEVVNADRSFLQPATTSHDAVKEELESSASSPPPSPPASPMWLESDGGGATKGKFTTYYEEDRIEDRPPPPLLATTVDEAEFAGGRDWWWRWETAVRLRDGERGWYKFQDLRAINGNVVKLWDEN